MLIEGILTLVIVVLVLIMIGVPLNTIIGIAVMIVIPGILALMIAFFVLFFTFTGISLLFFRRERGTFLRIDENGHFERAVYSVNGTEYICIFPAESVARRAIYQSRPDHFLLVSRSQKRRRAYDRHSLFIIGIGVAVSLILTAVILYYLPNIYAIFIQPFFQ